MKSSKLIIGVFFVIIILLLIGFYYPNSSLRNYLSPEETKTIPPEPMIEIKKSTSGDVIINEGDVVFFSAKNSTDRDGKIENYIWDFDDGNISKIIDPVHKFDAPGIYNVSLTVVDNDGKEGITWIFIKVNALPIARLKIDHITDPSNVKIPIHDWIQFNGSESYDPDSSINSLKFNWDFGDGNYSTELAPKHQYNNLGKYYVQFTVIDNDGGRATESIEIEIILRKYRIDWVLEQIEEEIEPNGYTLEGEWTELFWELQQEQLVKVMVNLTWKDQQPLLKNNETKGQDLFELNFLTPENISKIQNSTSGNISMNIIYHLPMTSTDYQAKTANDAINLALNDADFIGEGNGEWYFNVSALECKGGNWINDQFDLDIGNIWTLKIILFYYNLEITDITHD